MDMLLAGALVGLVLGLTGSGGGVLALPALLALGMPFSTASPIALASVALSASLGAALAFRDGQLRYRAAGLMALCGITAAPLGLGLAHRLPVHVLLFIFACVLAWVAFVTWRRARRVCAVDGANDEVACRINPATGRLSWTPSGTVVLSLLGAVAGAASGLLGVGGGFVIVPGLQRFSNIPMSSIVGTSLAVVAPVSLWTAGTNAVSGRLDTLLALPFVVGALAGMVVGRMLARRLPAPLLQKGFALVAAAVAAGMAFKALTAFAA